MHAQKFLADELAHAELKLARVRRIAVRMQAIREAASLAEVAVDETLATNTYRQLQRDEVTYQKVWLRVQRHLARLTPPQTKPTEDAIPIDQAQSALRQVADARPEPCRKPPAPGRNAPCSCGSSVKFKRCRGYPPRQAA